MNDGRSTPSLHHHLSPLVRSSNRVLNNETLIALHQIHDYLGYNEENNTELNYYKATLFFDQSRASKEFQLLTKTYKVLSNIRPIKELETLTPEVKEKIELFRDIFSSIRLTDSDIHSIIATNLGLLSEADRPKNPIDETTIVYWLTTSLRQLSRREAEIHRKLDTIYERANSDITYIKPEINAGNLDTEFAYAVKYIYENLRDKNSLLSHTATLLGYYYNRVPAASKREWKTRRDLTIDILKAKLYIAENYDTLVCNDRGCS